MGAQTTEGTGFGSAEGPIRGLGDVTKILKKNADGSAFSSEDSVIRETSGGDAVDIPIDPIDGLDAENVQEALEELQEEVEAGGIPPLAENITVIPVGDLTSTNVQDALEEHQDDIDNIESDVAINAFDIFTNATNIDGKIDKISAPVTGNFPLITATGEVSNSTVGPDDYYTQGEIDALEYSHSSLLDLQGGSASERYHLTNAQHTNLTDGDPTFDTIVLNDIILNDSQATTKEYVDSIVAGSGAWLDPVIDFSTEAAATETTGFRYIASADGSTWTKDNIYEYNGASWDETVIASGNTTFVEDLGLVYLFTGTSWVDTGGVFQIIMT